MFKKMRNEQYGQALIELALVLPILLLLLSGIVEMGRIGYTYMSVNNAARVGARVASIGGSDQQIVTAITQSTPTLNPANLTVQILPSPTQRQSGAEVTVELSYQVDLVVPIIAGIIPDPFSVGADVTMRLE